MAKLPATPADFAQFTDPKEIAEVSAKLKRYVERGEWAARALASLPQMPPQDKPPTKK